MKKIVIVFLAFLLIPSISQATFKCSNPTYLSKATCTQNGFRWAWELDEDNNGYLDAESGSFNLDPSADPAGARALIGAETAGAAATVQGNLDSHEADTGNPHSVTKAQVGLTNVEDVLHAYNQAGDPTVNDDSGDGYAAGYSFWLKDDGTVYLCTDDTVGASVWAQVGSIGGGTDDQAITEFSFDGSNLTITLEDDAGGQQSVDLSSLTELTSDELGAVQNAATAPTAINPFVTVADAATAAQGATADTAIQPGDAATLLDGNPWKVFYIDGSGDVVELALGTAGQVLSSNGAALAPTFEDQTGGVSDHGALTGLTDDDHTQYGLADGTRAYTGKVSYSSHPSFVADTEIVDKKYVDDAIVGGGSYTDEQAQDAVGGILDDGSNGDIVFTYNDAGGLISADVQDAELSILESQIGDLDHTDADAVHTGDIGVSVQAYSANMDTDSTDDYTVGGTDVALGDGGTGASLVDPNADRLLYWNDTAGATQFLDYSAWDVNASDDVSASTDLSDTADLLRTSDIGTAVLAPDGDGGSLTNVTDAAAIHDDTANEISALTEKVSPVSADLVIIEDSEAVGVKKKVQVGNLPGGSETDPIAGAVNGIIKADGAGNLSAASAGTDYLAPGALPDGTTATTQAARDNSTKVATTAYVDAADTVLNIISDYGAVGDGLYAYDGVSTASDQTFTSAGASWVSGDIGKTIIIPRVGTNGLPLQTTIASINSGTSIELTNAPSFSRTGVEYVYGTDDSQAFQDFLDDQNSSEWDTTAWEFRLHPKNVLVVPAGRVFVMASGATITNKDDWGITGGGTIVFADIKAFTITSCRRYSFVGMQIDGMTYDSPNTAPTNNTFAYIDHSDTTFENRSRSMRFIANDFRRMKHFIDSNTTWNGVELKIWDNHGIGYAVKDSVAFRIRNTSDNEIFRNVVSGFHNAVYQSATGTHYALNHFYNDYGVSSVAFTGDTDGSTAVVTNITDTSNMRVGKQYQISAGFPSSTTYYELLSKTATTATFDTNSDSAQSSVEMMIYTSDYLYNIDSTANTSMIQESIDNSTDAEIRLGDVTNFSVTNSKFFRTTHSGMYFIFFDPSSPGTGLDGVIVKDNLFNVTVGTTTDPFSYSANVTLANSVDSQIGPNAYGALTSYDNRWYVDPDGVVDDGTTSTTWADILTGGTASAGGSNTQLQYNNSGNLGGATGWVWETGSDGLANYSEAGASNRGLNLEEYVSGAAGPRIQFKKARGADRTTPTAVSSGDNVMIVAGLAYDGSQWDEPIRLKFVADAAPTSGSHAPTALVVQTNNDGSGLSERFRITSDGFTQAKIDPQYYTQITASTYDVPALAHYGGQLHSRSSGTVRKCLADAVLGMNFTAMNVNASGTFELSTNATNCTSTGYGNAEVMYINGSSSGDSVSTTGTAWDEIKCRAVEAPTTGNTVWSCYETIGTGWN